MKCPVCADAELTPADEILDPSGNIFEISICPACLTRINATSYATATTDPTWNEREQRIGTVEVYGGMASSENIDSQVASWSFLFDLHRRTTGLDSIRNYVEVGYGSGLSLLCAAQRCDAVVGIDIESSVFKALPKSTALESRIKLHETTDNLLPLTGSTFCVLWHTIEHFPYPSQILKPLVDKLPNGSIIAAQVPLFRREYVIAAHFAFYDMASLPKLMARHGVLPIEVSIDRENSFVTFVGRRGA